MTILIFLCMALAWLGFGGAMIAFPFWAMELGRRSLFRVDYRFFFSQTLIIFGLFLMIGTNGYQWFWLWISLGGMLILKGLLLLGSTDGLRHQLQTWYDRVPPWTLSLVGVFHIGFAVLLVIDTLRGHF